MNPPDTDKSNSQPIDYSDLQKKAEAFFGGKMSLEESTAFEHDMVADPELARGVYEAMGMGPIYHEAVQAMRTRQLESHARIADRSVSKQVPWWGRTRSRLVLTVVVAALAFVAVFVSNIGEVPEERASSWDPTDPAVAGMSPYGDIAPLPAQFVWPAHDTATQYRFEIHDESSQLVHATLTSGTTLIVAMDDLVEKGFRSGYWRIVPVDRSGDELEPRGPVPIRAAGH